MAITYFVMPPLAVLIPMFIPLIMKIVFHPMKKKLMLTKEMKG